MTAFVDPESVNPELRSLFGDPRPVDRRAFIVTSLGAGFAAAVLPVSAQPARVLRETSPGMAPGPSGVLARARSAPGSLRPI